MLFFSCLFAIYSYFLLFYLCVCVCAGCYFLEGGCPRMAYLGVFDQGYIRNGSVDVI